jgi:predicted cupin superfamily sugar epimerase
VTDSRAATGRGAKEPAAASLIQELALQSHPEGGWYREIHRSATRVDTVRGPRSAVTTILYLLERDQLSRWHVVQADEVWHFYGGAPLELLAYRPTSRELERHHLGHVSSQAQIAPVAVIPAGVWQAARSLGDYTLVGCTVGPGFEFADFEFVAALPAHAEHFRGELSAFTNLF